VAHRASITWPIWDTSHIISQGSNHPFLQYHIKTTQWLSGSRCDYTNDQRYPCNAMYSSYFDAFVSLCSQVRSSLTLLQSTCRL
jgi:hypothetical protein